MKVLFTDIKKSIISPKFLFGVILILLLCLLSDAPSVSSRNPMSVLDEIVRMRRSVWLEKGSAFCNLNIIYNFNSSVWYPIVLPVITAFPAVYSFCDEWFSDNYFMTLSRCGYKKYAFSKTVSSFFSGVCIFLGGLLLFSLIAYAIFPQQNEYRNVDLYFGNYRTFGESLVIKIINNSVLCGLYSVISMTICLILRDKFFTLSFLMVIQYFSTKLDIKFQTYQMEHNNPNMMKYRILFPDQHDNLYSLLPSYGISFYWYLYFALAVMFIIMLCIYFIIRRRYKNAS